MTRNNREDVVGIRVLIVDDTDHVREMLAQMLKLDGFSVVGTAAGATEAIDSLGLTQPDIVIMDLKMPIVDGIAATKLIREEHQTLPIVLYTAYLDDAIAERAHDA